MREGGESEKRIEPFVRPRTLVLGDLHLVRDTPADVVDDLCDVVREAPGARLVFAGDLFDLSADHPGSSRASRDRSHALALAFAAQPRVVAALREHVDRGGEVVLLGGNHDAALGEPEDEGAVARALGVTGDATARVRTSPWFVREGGLHVEHGHLFDPDNATTHPLVSRTKSLGVHFVEEFIAPTGAFRYLNSNDGTPLKLLASAFAWYGARGPYVVYKYFDAAFRAVAASGPFFADVPSAEEGASREAAFREKNAVDDDLVRALLELKATPTMHSVTATFQRLYLDRVGATVALLSGIALAGAGRKREALYAAAAGAFVMSVSWALGHDRYGGSVPQLLANGAERIADHTGARLVVMGHAHRENVSERYANTGSFSFPREREAGRPYLEIEGTLDRPKAVLRRVSKRPS